MIVKDERENLPRCLASVQPYIDEMIIVDTGSLDNTVEIALHYKARVKHFTWCDDFSAARNYAITQASGDWILMLDADEELVVNAENWRSRLATTPEVLAYWLLLTDTHQPLTALRTPRLFRNLPSLRYAGRYHEHLRYDNQLIPDNLTRDLRVVEILHYGYSDEQLRQKNLNRDIPLLEAIRQQEQLSLLLLGTLADAYLRTEQLDKAEECWEEAFNRLLPHLLSGNLPESTPRLPALLFTIGAYLLHQQQDYETLLLIAKRGLEWFPNYPPLCHLTGLTLKELGFGLGASAYFNLCLKMGVDGSYYRKAPFDKRFITFLPAYDLGLVYRGLNLLQEAKDAFELALSFAPDDANARENLEAVKQVLNPCYPTN